MRIYLKLNAHIIYMDVKNNYIAMNWKNMNCNVNLWLLNVSVVDKLKKMIYNFTMKINANFYNKKLAKLINNIKKVKIYMMKLKSNMT